MGGQAVSVKRMAALPMAVLKPAILTSRMLGLRTGRQPHLQSMYMQSLFLLEQICILKNRFILHGGQEKAPGAGRSG